MEIMEDEYYEQCAEVASWLLGNSEYLFDMAFDEARELFYENRDEFDDIVKLIKNKNK